MISDQPGQTPYLLEVKLDFSWWPAKRHVLWAESDSLAMEYACGILMGTYSDDTDLWLYKETKEEMEKLLDEKDHENFLAHWCCKCPHVMFRLCEVKSDAIGSNLANVSHVRHLIGEIGDAGDGIE